MADRQAAWRRFVDRDLPTAALEEWRYSRIDQLDLDDYRPAGPADQRPTGLPDRVAALVAAIAPSVTIVTSNGGAPVVTGSDPAVTVVAAGPETDAEGSGAVAGEPDALTALNAALSTPVTIEVAAGSRPVGPIVVVHQLVGDGLAAFPRTVVQAGRGSEVSVVELAVSGDVTGLVVPVSEIDADEAAIVTYVHLQQLGPRVWQSGLQSSRVGRDATFTSTAIALGGDYARLRLDSALVGQGATARLLAVYFGSSTRMVDFRTTQGHRAPKTTSELLFKGAVANRSQAVYSGLIRVEKGAGGTNAFQTNRNLVLHEGAHAESVPNLEIEDNDVRCSHASAVGPIAEDQRFYLESRGVPDDVADRLITLGFLDEVLARVAVTPVAAAARLELARILEEADAAEAAGTHVAAHPAGPGASGPPVTDRGAPSQP